MLYWFSTQVGLGLLRNALLSVGVSFIANGWFTKTEWSDLVGALITVVSVAVSAWSNRQHAQANAVVATVARHPSISITTNTVGKPVVTAPAPGTAGSMTGLSVTGH